MTDHDACALALESALSERDLLAQAMWDMYTALGFDTDGDTIPGHMIAGMGHAGFAKAMVDAAKEARKNCNEADGIIEELERKVAKGYGPTTT